MHVDEGYATAVNRKFRWIKTMILVGGAVLLAVKFGGSSVSWWIVLGGPLAAYVLSEGARGWIHGTRSIRNHREP